MVDWFPESDRKNVFEFEAWEWESLERRAARAARPDGRIVGRQTSPPRCRGGTEIRRTLDRLRDLVRRPPEPREPLPHAVSSARPAQAFILDVFLQNFAHVPSWCCSGAVGDEFRTFVFLDGQ